MPKENESLASILERTKFAIIAEVKSISAQQEDGDYRTLDFTALPLRIIDGDAKVAGPVLLRYSEGLPHFREQISGSGMEFHLKAGDEVILLIGDVDADSGVFEVLRVEPRKNIDVIRKFRDKHSNPGDATPG